MKANPSQKRRFLRPEKVGAVLLGLLLTAGVFGSNQEITSTGNRLISSIGRLLNIGDESVEDFQMTKEYLHFEEQLLAIEDKDAAASPPTDLAVWRPASGTWWVLGGHGSQSTTQNWGIAGDIPVQGDYDGDKKTDFAIFRPSSGQWWVSKSSTGGSETVSFGTEGDVPLTGTSMETVALI